MSKHTIILLFVLIAGILLRFYQLGSIPNGLYQDETAIGYNAYSILETGKDEHGESYPLYFKSFGDWKLPIYIYTAVSSVQAFGLNAFAVRLPSALFGSLTVILMYFFVKRLTRSPSLALTSTALLSINPWHLHYSRATFEVSIGLFLFLLGSLLLLHAEKRKGFFFVGTLLFVINMYTYNLTRLLSPLLYIVLLRHVRWRKIASAEKGITLLGAILAAIPMILTLTSAGGASSASGTLIHSSAVVQAPLLELRSYLITFPTLFTKVFFNSLVQTMWVFLQHVAQYLSVPFFFISGSTHGNHGIGNVGQFYLFELPLLLIGVHTMLRKQTSWRNLILVWIAVIIVVVSFTREAPHATRSFFLIPLVLLITAVGIQSFAAWVKRLRGVRKGIMSFAAIALILYSLVYYFSSYYGRFPVAYAKQWNQQDAAVSAYLYELQSSYDTIVIDARAPVMYTSILFYQQFDPDTFHKTVERAPDDAEGFSRVERFGNYVFRDVDWALDRQRPSTLIITHPEYVPDGVPIAETFAFPKRPVVVADKQSTLSFPVEDVAYVAIHSSSGQ